MKLDKIVTDCAELYGSGSLETKTELKGISTYLQQIEERVLKPEIRERGFHVLNKPKKVDVLSPKNYVTEGLLAKQREQ
jgi:hypothetical protein